MYKNQTKNHHSLRRLYAFRGWLYPIVLVISVVILSAAKITGSSIGVYDYLLANPHQSTFYGKPQVVRSDEWLVNTPLVKSQAANDFKTINDNIGLGSDMAIIVDVPVKDPIVLLKPQNIAFLFLSFDVAFAFKWWFLLLAVSLSFYWLALTLFPRRYLMAAGVASLFMVSPFIQWWYQSITILTIAFGLCAVTAAMRGLRAQTKLQKLGLFIATAYSTACFVVVIYPPFQIAVAFILVALFAAYFFALTKGDAWASRLKRLLVPALGVGVGAITALAALYPHLPAIQATLDTVYPGSRVVPSGGLGLSTLAQWPLGYILQYPLTVNPFGNNQSESSQFLLFGIVILPVLLGVAIKHRASSEQRLWRYLTYAISLVGLLFLIRMLVPFGSVFYNLIGFSGVQPNRLHIGLGVLSSLAVLLAMARNTTTGPRSYVLPFATGLYGFGTIYVGLRWVQEAWPIPASIGPIELLIIAVGCGTVIGLLLAGQRWLRFVGLAGILVFGFMSVRHINPLIKGTSALSSNVIVTAISRTAQSDPESRWVVSNKYEFESLPASAGAKTLSGAYPYPQTALWQDYFKGDAFIYNRFAHAIFNVDDTIDQRSMTLIQQDTFKVNLNSCDEFLKRNDVNYIVVVDGTVSKFNCFSVAEQLSLGGNQITIYKRK